MSNGTPSVYDLHRRIEAVEREALKLEREHQQAMHNLVTKDLFAERTETLLGKIAIVSSGFKQLEKSLNEMSQEQKYNRHLLVTERIGVVAGMRYLVVQAVLK